MISVSQLIKKLEKIKDKNKIVLISSDSEGNSFSPFSGEFSDDGAYYDEEDREIRDKDDCESSEELSDLEESCKKCIILWPE